MRSARLKRSTLRAGTRTNGVAGMGVTARGAATTTCERASPRPKVRFTFHDNGFFSNLHVITNHNVELTGNDSATGLVYLVDFDTNENLKKTGNPLFWLGVYDEEYQRTGEGWRIARQSLSFIWPERHLCDNFPPTPAGR